MLNSDGASNYSRRLVGERLAGRDFSSTIQGQLLYRRLTITIPVRSHKETITTDFTLGLISAIRV